MPLLHARAALLLLPLVGFVGEEDPAEDFDLAPRLEELRREAELPALAAAYTDTEGSFIAWAAGTRRAGGEERATADDLWHLGSCTKSMTATLIALLVERGDLDWDAALGDLLPEVAGALDEAYRTIGLRELLSHRAGLPDRFELSPEREAEVGALPLREQRHALSLELLGRPPVHPPRGAMLYSNFGYVIAGHLAELATGKDWEQLMRELLFVPLGMTSAGFGPPGQAGACTQPRGHGAAGEPVEPGPEADNPPVIGPAGTVHASLADWAKYLRLHLRGAKGDVQVGEILLHQATFALLHQAYASTPPAYAMGWVVERRDWAGGDGSALWHNGSNTLWYCVSWLGLGNGCAALVVTNRAGDKAAQACDRAAGEILRHYAGGRGGPKSTSPTSGGR